jgi:hypothetical protein
MNNDGMTFSDALKELKKGKLISRKSWTGEYWLSLSKSAPTKRINFFSVGEKVTDNPSDEWTAYHDDILAEDWIIAE